MTENIYGATSAPIQDSLPVHSLEGLDYKTLKKLYNRSRNINALAFIWFLGGLLLLGIGSVTLFVGENEFAEKNTLAGIVFLVLGVGQLFGVYCTLVRTAWSRFFGIVLSALMLVSFNILLIIAGIFGLFAMIGSPELFGAGRVTQKEIKEAMEVKKPKGWRIHHPKSDG